MSDPVFADIHGAHYTIASAVPVPPPSGGSGAPIIPSTAGSKMLDDSNNWQGEHDTATSGTSTGSTKYLGSGKGRLFQMSFTKNAGFRWHNMFIRDTTPTHYCYKVGVSFDRPDLLGCVELDFQHVIGPSQVVYACTQATSWNKCWEYTTTPTGKCQWNKSNIAVNPLTWPANTMQQIAIFTHRDTKGNVFYDGVEFGNTYTAFAPSCHGLSMLKQNWTVGDLLINFQIGGRGDAGAIATTALNLIVYYWQA